LFITTSRGTTHKPMPVDCDGFHLTESQVYATLLHEKYGIPWDSILEENVSLDTIGNAYFSRVMHIDPLEITDITIVTSDFHMERTRLIFNKVFSLEDRGYNLCFIASENVGIESLEGRLEREAKSCDSFKKNTKCIETMKQMHQFIHKDHLAYSTSRLSASREKIDASVLTTY